MGEHEQQDARATSQGAGAASVASSHKGEEDLLLLGALGQVLSGFGALPLLAPSGMCQGAKRTNGAVDSLVVHMAHVTATVHDYASSGFLTWRQVMVITSVVACI